MSHLPLSSLAGMDRGRRDNERPTSVMERSGVRTSREAETIVMEHLLSVTAASAR